MKKIKANFTKTSVLILAYIITILVFVAAFSLDVRNVQHMDFLRILMLILFIPIFIKYFFHIILAPWYGVLNKTKCKLCNNYNPKVTMIVPAYNEEVGIVANLESIVGNTYENMELIVVNDGSSDSTEDLVKTFIANYHGKVLIRYIKKENGGKSSAINQGLKISRAEIIITTDADSFLDKEAIANLVKCFQNKAVMSVAGNVKVGNNQKLIGDLQKFEYHYGFYFKRADSILNSVYIVGGAAAAYRREIFNELGGFDEEIITEDIEYSTRILNAGYKIKFAHDAIFYTEAPSDMSGLVKQRLRWKYGRLMTFWKYRNLFFSLSRKHSKFLTFIVLPVALFAETLLFFEILLLPIFFSYLILSHDFLPLAFLITIMTVVVFYQIFTDAKIKKSLSNTKFAPIAWLMFYFIDFVEYIALMKCLARIITNKRVEWQSWQRKGVF